LALYKDGANEAITIGGQSFIVLQATGSGVLSGAFSNIASGQIITATDGTASFLVTINQGSNGDVVLSDFQVIPEPGVAGLLSVGGIMVMRRRRSTRGDRQITGWALLGKKIYTSNSMPCANGRSLE
jgi:hypothetical protein